MPSVPSSPVDTTPLQVQSKQLNGVTAERVELRESIDRGWANAAADFRRRTNLELGDFNGGRRGVLESLRSAYGESNEKTKKKEALWQVVERVLMGVEWVGSLASSIGGLFFPPAGACFCAIEALINIPRLLRKISDDLRELFDRIMNFFSTLRVLRRADAQFGLDGELVRKTNDILMCLVKVCAIAIHTREHKLSALTSSLFLGENEIKAALEEFKTHCEDQNNLITTVTLEEAMQTRSMTKDIDGRTIVIEGQAREANEGVKEANEGIKDLRADNAYRKNREATRNMVSRIQNEWKIREAETTGPLHELGPCQAELQAGTFDALKENDLYAAWSDKERHRNLLYLSGDAGTGRTFLLAALARHIEEERRGLVEGDPSIYLVYYAFKGADEADADEDKGKDTALHTALKIAACRLAQQSTTYAKLLFEQYRSLRYKTLEDLWTQLKFESFDAPSKSMLYLCFDGLDQLKNPEPIVDALELITTNDRQFASDGKLRLRIILTGGDDIRKKRASIPTINVSELNKPIIKQYVQSRMQDIVDVHDPDTLSSSNLLVKDILKCVKGSFSAADQRLKIVRDGMDEDLDFDEIHQSVKSQKISTLEQEVAQILVKACAALKPHHREQLKEILYWSAFGYSWPAFDLLQSSLFLQRPTRSLESLESKIRGRFTKVLSVRGNRVVIDSKMSEYIRSVKSDSSLPTNPVSMSDNGEKPESNVANRHDNADQLQVSTIEGQYTIIKRCLQALNADDPTVRKKTRSVLTYASAFLPEHIYMLNVGDLRQLSVDQRQFFGQGLIEFLSDEECIDLVWTESPLNFWTWIDDRLNVVAMGKLLKDKDMLLEMSPKNRRIAKRLTQQLPGCPAPFLELLTIRAGSYWLQQDSRPVGEDDDADQDQDRLNRCYLFVDKYLDLLQEDPQTLSFESTTEPDNATETVQGRPSADDDHDSGNPVRDNAADRVGSRDENPNVSPETKSNDSPLSDELGEGAATELEHKDAGSGSEETPVVLPPPELSVRERVDRARHWVLERLNFQENDRVFTRIGQVLVNKDDSAAIEYLLKVSAVGTGANFGKRYIRGRTLATAYANQERFADAYVVLTPVIDELSTRLKEMPLAVADQKKLAVVVKQAAECLTKLQKDNEAIALLKECLGPVPDNSACHQELVRLLCKNKQIGEAESAFENWITSSEGNAAQSPASYFPKAAVDEERALAVFFFWTRGTSIHDRLVRILDDAIADAKKNKRARDACLLLLNHGFAHAIVGQEERRQQARNSWADSITYGLDPDLDDPYLCIESTMLVVQYEFDTAVKRLRAQPEDSLDVKKAVFERFKLAIQSHSARVQTLYGSLVFSPMAYAAVFARLAGLVDEAQAILKPDMEKALEVLSNSDPQDDELAFMPLYRIMLVLGDIVGASSFWSFYDRTSLAAKRKELRSRLTDSDALPESAPEKTANDPNTAVNRPGDHESHDETYVTDFRFSGGCNSCTSRVTLDSRLEMEIWSCTYCPNMDFCRECYEKIKSNQNERVICSSEHVHVLMKHYDYEEAEVCGSNVRIDWQLVESNEGRDRQRIGGRIVKLDDWVQILRKEWDVPENKTEGRLQK